MTLTHLFEDFGDLSSGQTILSEDTLEEYRLEAFEKGYQAGWEDASKAHEQNQAHVSTELARNLEDLAFTYHEAEAAVIANIEPLFDALFHGLLPDLARDAFQPRIVSEMVALAREIGSGTMVLTVAPAQADRVQALLPKDFPLPVSVQADDSLGDGQAFLRIGARERMVDLDGALAEIKKTVAGFFERSQGNMKHG